MLVLDAHAPSRLGYHVMLRREPWVAECLSASDPADAAALAERRRPAVALVEMSEAGPFVVATCQAIRAASPETRILLASRGSDVPPSVVRQAGAVGLVPSDASPGRIVELVREAVSADAPATPAFAEAALTNRELQVLRLMASGATNREIADELHVSAESVKKHARAIYRKLGVRNRTEAVRRAVEERR